MPRAILEPAWASGGGSVLLTRRVLLRGLGGIAITHVVGCASQATARPVAPPAPRASPANAPGPLEPVAEAAPLPEPVAEPAAPEPPVDDGVRRLRLPDRPASAESGSAFLERTEALGRQGFEDAVYDAVSSGNVPPYQRVLLPVVLAARGRSATVHVMCDYLAIGSDEDFVRMPMTASTAQRICNLVGAILPTTRLVDEIYRQATARLPPSFIEGGPDETSRVDYVIHHTELERHRAKRSKSLGVLTAGNKKDIVLCDRLVEKDDRVAIYGWHKRDGDPIQPLSTVHSRRYADYSHGVRLVDQRMTIDGDEHRFDEVLRDPALAALVSDEGPLRIVSYPTTLPPYEPSKSKRKPKRRRDKKPKKKT